MANRRSLPRLGAAILLAAVSLVSAVPALADLTFPKFTGYVVDGADIIPADAEAALTAKLKTFQDTTGHQFAVATVPSLQGTDVEDFGNRLFRDWKLGDKTRNDGALLLVAPSERKVRIEVGYGLEGDLTDAVSRLIIENAILPRFKSGDFPGGITRGADDVIAVFSGHAEDYKARAAAFENDNEMPLWMTIAILLFMAICFYVMFKGGRRGRGRRSSPWIIGGGSGVGGGWSSGSGGGGFGGGGGGSSGGGGASGGW